MVGTRSQGYLPGRRDTLVQYTWQPNCQIPSAEQELKERPARRKREDYLPVLKSGSFMTLPRATSRGISSLDSSRAGRKGQSGYC